MAAPARHVVATVLLLDPEPALPALFVLMPDRKVPKGLVALIRVLSPVLFASLTLVISDAAVQAVARLALGTGKFFVTIRVKDKGVVTVGCGTPGNIRLLADCLVEG